MTYEEILYEVEEGVAKITLNRPEVRNRLSTKMIGEILEALDRARNDAEVRVLIITGAGDQAFCAGADISEFQTRPALEHRRIYDKHARLPKAFRELGKPSISAVNGLALAGGLGLAIYSDITIASDRARFGTPEINIGVWPMIVSATLRRVIGRKRTLQLMLTGEIIDAHEAERIGLVSEVVQHDRLMNRAMEIAGKLKAKSPVILKLGREAYYDTEDVEFDKAVNYLRDMVLLLLATEDAQEGVRAFLEKRPPVWKGA